MKNRFLIPLVLFVVSCTGGNRQVTNTESRKEEIMKEARLAVDSLFGAIESNDYEKLISMYDTTSGFISVGSPKMYDYKSLVRHTRKVFPLVEKQTMETRFEKYVIIDPYCFQYVWAGANGVYMKSGEIAKYDDVISIITFKKEDGTWKIISIQEENYNMPSPQVAGDDD